MKTLGLYEIVGRLLYNRKLPKSSKIRLLSCIMSRSLDERRDFFTTLILDLTWVDNHTTQELYDYLVPREEQVDLDERYELGQDIGSEDWDDALLTQIKRMDPKWLLKILGDQGWIELEVVRGVLDKMGYPEHRTWRTKVGSNRIPVK